MTKPEIKFLSGPQSRWKEFKFTVSVLFEFIKGLRALHFVGPCVTVFGSARFKEGHPDYEVARELSGKIAQLGFTILTGGGPGIMEAANRGARDVAGRSIGCNIVLPKEQRPNPYLDTMLEFHYFFVRKLMLIKYSRAFLAFPGGFGTMDELFEALTWGQLGIQSKPIGLLNVAGFYNPLLAMICLLYTSDAADERSSGDLGGRRIIKKKKTWSGHQE